jgi:large subunit ribosomal protein L20
MVRVKRGVTQRKRHKKVLKLAKGYQGQRGNLFRQAKQAVMKAGMHAYRHRREKKREMRALWILRINAATREQGMSYSRFIAALQDKGITLDRKILAHLATTKPEVFAEIVKAVGGGERSARPVKKETAKKAAPQKEEAKKEEAPAEEAPAEEAKAETSTEAAAA